MKSFQELQEIAKQYIQPTKEIPQNPFVLLSKLNIEFKTKNQASKDFGIDNPLLKSPAIIVINKKPPILYFDENSYFWKFYIFHELAHYILKHKTDGIKQEWEANMLACCLIAPTEYLPTYMRTAKDINTLCYIPIDKAEEYWEYIYQDIRHDYISDVVNDYLADIHCSVNRLLNRVEILIDNRCI